MKVINEREIMKIGMKERGLTQTKLAERMDTTQRNLSACMNRSRVSMEVFKEVMDALEYDVIVVDRRTGESLYRLEM